MKQKKFFGTIFFPETPTKRIHGVWLLISSNSILIETSHNSLNNKNWPIILGEFNGLDQVTFVNCRSAGGSSGAGGVFTNIKASYLISGSHIYQKSKLNFNAITLTSPTLSEWINEDRRIEEISKGLFRIPEHQEIVNVCLENIYININLAHRIRSSNIKLEVKKACTVSISCKDLISIDTLSEVMRHLKKLILFLTNKNPEFDRNYLRIGDEIQYELINSNEDLREEKFTQGIDIQYYDTKDLLEKLILNWFSHKKLYPVIDLVLEKCFNTQMSTQGFFLNVCVSLESFHDSYGKEGKGIIDPLTVENRKKIIALIENEELLKWFKKESSYWKNPTLKDRLKQFEETIEGIKGAIFKFNTETFITKVVKTRNKMAHNGEFDTHFNHIELFLATKIIEYTIRLEILKLMGFDINKGERSLLKRANRSIEILSSINKYHS